MCLKIINQAAKNKKGTIKMEDKELKILEFMKSEEYIPMRAKEIAMLMRVPKKEYNDFLEALGNLELNFKIEKNRKNRYRVIGKTKRSNKTSK